MKKTLLFLATILTTSIILGQNSFPSSGNVGIGTTAPIGKLDINTGSSATYNMSGQGSGIISFGNAGNISQPSIISKTATDNASGLILFAGTSDISNVADMRFDVRKNDSNDFTTLTSTAFRFTRAGISLINILRNGNMYVGNTAFGTSKINTSASGAVRLIEINREDASVTPGITGGAGLCLSTVPFGNGFNGTFGNNVLGYSKNPLESIGIRALSVPLSDTGTQPIIKFEASGASTNAFSGIKVVDTRPILGVYNYTTQLFNIQANGNVGIGTSTPIAKFHILDSNGGVFFDGANATFNRFKSTAVAPINGKDLLFSAQSVGNTPDLYITSALGYIGIGTTMPDSKLTVNGTIHSTEVKVTQTVPADYVFEKYYLGKSSLKPDYTLLTLSDVERFTKTNHHLPNVPSAQEIKENGLHLGEMSNILLQKIEELTLYSIDQQKIIEKQTFAIGELEERLTRLEKELERKSN